MMTKETVTANEPRPTRTRQVWQFIRHYLEMIVAMLVGMFALYPLWMLTVSGADDGRWVRAIEVDMLAMATAMSVSMALWMRVRGHATRLIVEMSAAMYAGFVVLFPFLWAGSLGEMGVMMGGHLLMPLFMLVAMLARREQYVCAQTTRG